MVYAAGFFEPETFRLDPVFGGLGGEGLSVYPWYLLTIWLLSKSVPFHQVFLMIQPVLGMAYLLAASVIASSPWVSSEQVSASSLHSSGQLQEGVQNPKSPTKPVSAVRTEA